MLCDKAHQCSTIKTTTRNEPVLDQEFTAASHVSSIGTPKSNFNQLDSKKQFAPS